MFNAIIDWMLTALCWMLMVMLIVSVIILVIAAMYLTEKERQKEAKAHENAGSACQYAGVGGLLEAPSQERH